MTYYTVLTFPGGFPRQNLPNVVQFCEYYFEKFIIVTENGKRGNNFHVNIVYDLKEHINEDSFYKNAKRNWMKVYDGVQLPEKTKYLVKNKQCSSPENVIGGYLLKESNYQILKNEGYDLEEYKTIALENRKLNKPTFDEVVDLIFEKMEEHGYAYADNQKRLNPSITVPEQYKQNFKFAYSLLIHEGYKVSCYYKRLKEIYHIILIKHFGSFDHIEL